MTGSKDLKPSHRSFGGIFMDNQFYAKPQWPTPDTNLSGKIAIVTGSNVGLGYEAARQLLELKLSRLILAVRTPAKGEAAATQLRQQHPQANIEVWQLDMCSYESIQAFVRRVDANLPRVDYTLLNAGCVKLDFAIVEATGHEETVQVNFLSTMLLTLLLLPVLKAKKLSAGHPSHLTIVGAALALAAKFANRDANPILPSFDNRKTFDSSDQYNSSKLLAHMFLWKLVDCVSADDVIVNIADPAWCKGTDLARGVKGVMRVGLKAFELLGRTPRVGASCFVDALVNKGKESHGCFLMSWKAHPFNRFLYTPEGKAVIERVWHETLSELDFAGVHHLVSQLRS